MAEVAYPNTTAEEERKLTTMYLVGLRKGKIQDKLFDREPRLETLEDATEASYQEWARQRYRERALTSVPDPVPMEIDSLTIREKLSEQEKEIKSLKQKLATTKEKKAIPTNETNQTNTTKSQHNRDIKCFFCHKPGHVKNECSLRDRYWDIKGGKPRSLPPEERALN